MMELIVLGQVPGTSIQITYAQVLMLAAILLIASELRVLWQRRQVASSPGTKIEDTAL